MGKASSNKKVARAASTGGGRTAVRSGTRPWLWYAVMGVVVLLGLGGIFVSREQRRDELASGASLAPPVANRDHWHAAYAVVLCDQIASPIQDERDPKGIHTHSDGLIHIHPFVRSAAGDNATLGVFADAVRMTLTDEEIKLPGGKSHREGKTKCGDKPGIVQVKVGDKVITDDVRDIKMSDRDLITIAFAPEGEELPPPPSASELANPKDVAPQTPSGIPGLPEGTTTEGAPDTTGGTTDPAAGETTGGGTGGGAGTTGERGGTAGGTAGEPAPGGPAPASDAPTDPAP